MIRKTIAKTLAALAGGAALAPWTLACSAATEAEPPPPERRRPNVVIISTDDQGYADVGFQGSRDVPTPHVDALAAAGIRFTSGYVAHPFCSPSRAGMLTGRYPQRFGHHNNPSFVPGDPTVGLPVGETTLADVLRDAGYVTGMVGKWHLGAAPPFHPRRRGFQHFFGFVGGGHNYFGAPHPGDVEGEEYNIALEHDGRPVDLDGYLTEVFSRRAVDFVREHRDRPFLLYLAYNAPHTPYQAPAEYRRRFPDLDEDCRSYAAMVSALDDGVGRLTAALRELGLDRDTLIFYLSDNGGQTLFGCASNEPLRGRKGTLYEGGVRVPFLAVWPGRLAAGATYDRPVSALDILPTVAARADAVSGPGKPLDGVDLWPYLTGEIDADPHPALFWRLSGRTWAVRSGRWKLVRRGKTRQLFDLRADPGETTDLARGRPEVVRRLTAAYRSWSRELSPPAWPNPRPATRALPGPAPPGGGSREKPGPRPSQ